VTKPSLWTAPWAHTHQLARDLCWLWCAPPFWPWAQPSSRSPERDSQATTEPTTQPTTQPTTDLFTQPLWPATADAAVLQWLHALADSPDALVAHVAQALTPTPKPNRPQRASGGPPRLGRLAEALMDYGLRRSPACQWEASGVKLCAVDAAGHSTAQHIGELDYLWRTASGALVHGELAVKFYALSRSHEAAFANASSNDTNDTNAPNWPQRALDAIGPDGHENWQHKWHKLTHKQLAHALPAPWANEPVQRLAHVRGRWFVPVADDAALAQWACNPHAASEPQAWTQLLGVGPWSEPTNAMEPSHPSHLNPPVTPTPTPTSAPAGLPAVFTGTMARFGPRLSWAQARALQLPALWQCRLLERVEWLGPVSQASDAQLHAPQALQVPALHGGLHPRVQMLGIFAFDAALGVWCEQWRAWLDAEAPLEITI
jgi:hypothetical protein